MNDKSKITDTNQVYNSIIEWYKNYGKIPRTLQGVKLFRRNFQEFIGDYPEFKGEALFNSSPERPEVEFILTRVPPVRAVDILVTV